MTHLSTMKLTAERLCEALPLLRMALPGLDELRWAAHCEDLARAGGGVLAAAAAGSLHGIALYRPQSDLRRDMVIRIETMVACELSPAGPVRVALLAAMEELCSEIGARGLVLIIPCAGPRAMASPKSRSLERAGFQPEAALMWRPAQGDWNRATFRHAHLA
jgi:hypothetical protein